MVCRREDPKFRKALEAAVRSCEATAHFMTGGVGVSCFVHVVGPAVTPKGRRSKKLLRYVVSSNCLDMNRIDETIQKVPGYVRHYVNLD